MVHLSGREILCLPMRTSANKSVRDGSGEVFEGGRWIEAEAALDTIPIFLRGGKQEYLIHNV